jgi:hypothetical protein
MRDDSPKVSSHSLKGEILSLRLSEEGYEYTDDKYRTLQSSEVRRRVLLH